MNHTDFFTRLNKEILPVYLLDGPEEYIKQTAVKRMESILLQPGMEQLNEAVLENPQADEVIAAAETVPFMAEKRLVIVRDWGLFSGKMKEEAEQAEKMAEYLQNLPETVCLLFVVRGKADARKKLYQAIKKRNAVYTFDTLSEPECVKWVQQTVKQMGKTITASDASYLCFTSGRDAALLKGEMEKLCAHAGERENVTREDVDAVAVRSIECTVFEMVDQLVAGKTAQAFMLYENTLKNGGDPVGVLAMILRQYRILYFYRTMKENGMMPDAIRAALGIPPFAMEKTARQAAAYTTEQLKTIVNMLLDTEFKVKSGQMNQEGCAEQAMLRIAEGRK